MSRTTAAKRNRRAVVQAPLGQVPRIRFKSGRKWECVEFQKEAQRVSVSKFDENCPCVEYEDIVSGEGRFTECFKKKTTHKKGLAFKAGDVLFGKLRPYLRNIICALFDGVAVGDFWILREVDNVATFLCALVQSPGFMVEANKSAGSKMPRADWNVVSKMRVLLPKDVIEKAKIGELFKGLDEAIAISSRTGNALKRIKTSMLVKMFPQGKAKIPEIRFKGFRGEWKVCALSEYLEPSGVRNVNGRFSRDQVLSVSGEYGIVNQIKFKGRSFAGASIANYRVVETGDVVYTKSPLNSNPYGIVKANGGEAGIVSTLYAVYKPRENCVASFVQTYFDLDQRLNRYLRPLVRKGAKNDMKVSSEGALLGEVVFPSVDEQRKIAAFFTELDRMISAAEKKVAKLKQVKASLLERMFVEEAWK